MKNSKLTHAVILGLLLSHVCINVAAGEEVLSKGLNYNTGGLPSSTPSINDEVESNNGIYFKDYGEDDLLIKNGGISLGYFSDKVTPLTDFSVKNTGTITIEKSTVKVGGLSSFIGAITVDVHNDFQGEIQSGNLSVVNKLFNHRGKIAGIDLKSNDDSNNSFKIAVENDIVFQDFNQGILLSDDINFNLQSKNIKFTIGATKFISTGYNTGEGIVIDVQGNKSDIDREHYDAVANLKAADSIYFIDMDSAITTEGNNIILNVVAENTISIKNTIVDNNGTAIIVNTKGIGNINDITLNKASEINLAGREIIIDNYGKGISIDNDYIENRIGGNISLYADKVTISNVDTAISAKSKNNTVLLNDLMSYGNDEEHLKSNVNVINARNQAVLAETGGIVNITGAVNEISSDGYRTIHASGIDDGVRSQVDVNGAVSIINKNALQNVDDDKIAIVASADENTQDTAALGGIVNLNLNGTDVQVDNSGKYLAGNRVVGSVIAGQNGIVNINTAGIGNKGSIAVYGNVLAGNGGELNLDLGKGGYLEGRADDYQDADSVNWTDEHSNQFAPEFSKKVTSSGEVNISLGEGAVWNVTGQSWLSNLDGNGTVILCGADAEGSLIENGTDGYALHIGEINGSNTFIMNLKPDDLVNSDMLYVNQGTTETQKLIINNYDEVLAGMNDGDRIRFATVANAGMGGFEEGQTTQTFGTKTTIKNAGMFNVDFGIEYSDYNDQNNNDNENDEAYNGGEQFEDSNSKPGNAYVDDNYGTGINAKNIYLVRQGAGDLSDGGKTVLNMSRANYSNAVYMDRLNKRLGEARFIDGDEGMWVRLRHDRIGKSDAFRSQNTMYEIGYDKKQDCDNGEKRIGAVIDYMHGDTSYHDITGKGEIDRYGVWLYDTWLGDKGHYTDYVLKWGHLSNDFGIYALNNNNKITGDYSNDVFSISAEYGRKMDIGNDWYIEPQAQIQFARVTDADYVTSQGTKVSVDGINSMIGRAGFRIGRDIDDRSTVYVKADILHEFLGDQDISAMDSTTNGQWNKVSYENSGTWYDVGFGFATAVGHNSYAYLDFEKSFGNDNDETYQINAGLQWSF